MELGMVGLGRMGANMAQRLVRGGHRVVGFDPSEAARSAAAGRGVAIATDLAGVVAALPAPRTLWLMVPAGAPTDATLTALLPLLAPGDTLVDGGNSNYQDTLRRAADCAGHGLTLIDCGTSGGIWGLDHGYSLTLGGDAERVRALQPILATLAPAADRGWAHVGPVGAGHFAKMVHNGIEYGLMQAYAEGLAILARKPEFDFDLQQVASAWSDGSVVRSWLLERIVGMLAANPRLDGVAPVVADSGEGRWTVAEAIALDVPAPVITAALIARLRSRDAHAFGDRLLAALRHEFGGHALPRG